jgi:phosphatidylserine/phosphatidylglycerophosphate/cardiolipin synthase-like enzyme
MAGHGIWAINGTYPKRQGTDVEILIDGEEAYRKISDAFHRAKKFIYLTISYGDPHFLLVPERIEIFFDVLRTRQKDGVDVRMVVWQPALKTDDTIPDPAPIKIPGVNEGPGCIQARWDETKGYHGLYKSPQGLFEPWLVELPAFLGCHHQKTYIMDDGCDGYVAFVGGINPVQFYWDTPEHDVLNKGRVKLGGDPLKGLEDNPPLHDIFFRIKGPAVADVLSNFIERYNGASIPYRDVTSDVLAPPVTLDQIKEAPGGIEVQVVRTIAPDTYQTSLKGDQGIRELYFNMLGAANAGDLVYIENQYFFDHGIVAEIHEAAERGAKIIVVLTSKPDEGTLQGKVENKLEEHYEYKESCPSVSGHENVGLFTLGNYRSDPRDPKTLIISETYIHSKNMAVIGDQWAVMTGGSANIAFTSMWFHSEMNIAFTDIVRINNWVATLWKEHLGISLEDALALIKKPDEALNSFKKQAQWNTAALTNGQTPKGRVYEKEGTVFPPRNLAGIDLGNVHVKNVIAKSRG